MMETRVRGVRGAVTVDRDEPKLIHEATRELVAEMVTRNELRTEDIVSCLITVTDDISSAFPAGGMRGLEGFELVPLMCAREIPVPGSMPLCLRVMMHVNTVKTQAEIQHIYLGNAVKLRPDLVQK